MKLIATRKVKLATLYLPGDFKRRVASEHVKAAAKDLAKTPRLHRPGVRGDGKTIIFGRDRIAAAQVAGEKAIDVDVWECTDAEAERAEVIENLHRRSDNRDELVARLVALEVDSARVSRTATIDTTCTDEPPTKQEKVAARKAVAEKLGTTSGAIKAAERRAGHGWGDEGAAEAPAVEATIETWGVPLHEAVLTSAKFQQDYIDKLDGKLRQVVAAITEGQENLPEPVSQRMELQRLRLLMRDVSARLRSTRPVAVCPVCKRVPRFLEGCAMCGGTGLASEEEVKRAPKETTKKGGKAGIFVGPGDFRALDQVGNGDPRAA